MKAVRYYGPNTPLEIEDVEKPSIEENEVLINVKAAGICHTDLHFLDGTLEPWKGELPITLGHEIAGKIIKIGKKVSQFTKGDRVVVNNNLNCGKCYYCKNGHENLCSDLDQYGFTIDGGYSEKMKAVERNLVKLPKQIPYEIGSVLPCAAASVYHGLVDIANLQEDEFLMINGFGGLGSIGLQLANHLGAKTIVTDVLKEKLESAKKENAFATINAAKDDVREKIMSLTNNQGADVILELIGKKKSMENALNSLGKLGRYVLIGYTKDKLTARPLDLIVGEKKILGSVAYTQKNLKKVVELVLKTDIKPQISETFKLEEIPKALNLLKEGKIEGRAVAKI